MPLINFGTEPSEWLKLGALGAAVSTIGALLGILIKDYFFTRHFELWKQQRTLEATYQRFRDPLRLAARELASRTVEIVREFPTVYLLESVLESRPQRQLANSFEDAYYRRYKLVSTAYRLSAFLGWLELYRQEITFLGSANTNNTSELEVAVGLIRSDLADGQLNDAEDWLEWSDRLVFREELRAIGEALIQTQGAARAVMGYGRYCELLESITPNAVQRWAPVVLNFYLSLESNGKDFRKTRMKRMVVHLVDFVELLDRKPAGDHLREASVAMRHELFL